jgi:LytS/YehU family sensor histidine kinase
MFLFYSIILFLVLSLTVVSFLHFTYRRTAHATIRRQQNTITKLKMETIRNRMSPHFLFNALSGISAGTPDPESTKEDLKTVMLLLRASVDNMEQLAIPVKEELELVTGYISLQKRRIPQPFKFTCTVKEGTNLNQLIPAMILQIPVENAIKHGLMPLTGDKSLQIGIENYEGGLKMTVRDNGIGYKASAQRATGTGTGLKILFQTIHLLNSVNTDKIAFEINDLKEENGSSEGTIVRITVPENYSFEINSKYFF